MKRLLFDEDLQLLILALLLLLFVAGCWSAPPALRSMCVVQEHSLARYVEVANEAISKDEELLPEHRTDWSRVGEKLLRNQGTINKLVGANK